MWRWRLLLPVVFLLVAGSSSAQEPALVVENAHVIVGDGTVLERGHVVVAGERIVSVAEGPVEAPDARRIDASGKTVLPGLVDAHVHLLLQDLTSLPRSDGELEAFIRDGLPERLRAFLESGITTVLSTADFWPAIRTVRENIRSGELPGPRLFTSGPVLSAPGGSPASGPICGSPGTEQDNPWCREHIAAVVESRRQAREAVDRLAREGVDFVKMVSDSISPPGLEQLRSELVAEIVAAAHAHGLRAYAHINEMGHARTAVDFGLDGLVHVPFATSAEGQPEKLVEAMEARGVTAVTTSVTSQSLRDRFADEGRDGLAAMFSDNLRDRLQAIRRIADADASLVVLGTDTPYLPPAEAFHREVRLLEEADLTPAQIIQAATRNAATHLGREDDLGTLEAGKLADLIVVDGNPLEDLSALRDVEVVVQGGEVVAGRKERYGAETLPVHRQDWSQVQQEVWEREVAYWEAVEAADVERFMTLWDERFVGWPASEEEPVSRSDLRGFLEAWFDEVRSTEFRYDLTPLAVTVFDDIAITFYRAKSVYGDTDGGGSSEVGRLSHVWQKRHGEWTIIAGMSAPGEDDVPSPQR